MRNMSAPDEALANDRGAQTRFHRSAFGTAPHLVVNDGPVVRDDAVAFPAAAPQEDVSITHNLATSSSTPVELSLWEDVYSMLTCHLKVP